MANGSFRLPFVVVVCIFFSVATVANVPDRSQRSNEPTTVYHHPQHQSRMQVFVQTPTELRLVIDGLTIQSAADLVDYALLNGVALQTPPLRFDPGEVDFGETEFATAAQRRVTVHNPSNAIVHLLTITGSTAHYHCSFFEDNILFPGANTTFDVYFLPRERGNLSSVLEIHTSIGVFTLKLRGLGVESRYHMLPAINMKLPTNASFIYLMSLYNPFPRGVQIEEIFTSSAELHIELVTGNSDEDSKLWYLQPYETRPIMFLEFKGREATHFLAYVVIVLRVSSGKHTEIVKLFLPVDFEVTDGVGLFPSSPILDFGIVSPHSPLITLPVHVWNGYSRPVLVQNVTVSTANNALSVDFLPVRLAPDYLRQQTVAFIALNASMLTSRQQLTGEISVVVKGNQNNTAIIPYRIRYISGNLQVISSSNLSFNCQDGHCDWHAQPRFISLVNRAKSQIILYAVTVKSCEELSPYQLFLQLQPKSIPAIFAPSQSQRDLFSINVRKISSEESRTSRCGILLTTNVGMVELPVHVWDGRLLVRHHFVPTSNFFTHDVSVIYTGNEDGPVTRTLSLFNPNPVVVKIRKFDATSPYVFAKIIGISAAPKGNVYTLVNFKPVKDVALPTGEVPVPPDHFAVVEFYVNATEPPAIDSLSNILMWVVTDQPNRTPIVGSILFDHGNYHQHPDPIVMENCFPTRLCVEHLILSHSYRNSDPYHPYVEETDMRPHQLQFIEFLPEDPGLSYKFDGSYVYFAEKAQIATVTYDAAALCGDSCYVGLTPSENLHAHWLASCNLDGFAADIDSYLVNQLRRRWQDIKDSGRDIVNVTVILLTAEHMPHLTMPHHSFMQVHLTVPKLIHSPLPLNFNVVEVGQFDMLNFTIINPSFLPLAIQIVLLEFYPAASNRVLPLVMGNQFDQLSPGSYAEGSRTLEGEPVFSFLDLNFTVNFNKLITRDPSRYALPFPGASRCSRRSINIVLRPQTNFTVHVRFAPTSATEYKSFIILRNNLTFIETIAIRGQGGQGDLVLSDAKGRPLDKVEIAYSSSQLSDCNKANPASFLSSLLLPLFADKNGSFQEPVKPQPPYVNAAPSPYPAEPPFTVHRSLALRNLGRLPVYVTSVAAFGSSNGLRLTDVSGVHNHVIPTNGTINFQISFSPDFQRWRYSWTLVVNSTAGTVRYPVVVTLPPNLISACRQALPRPDWEIMLRLTIIFIVIPNVIGALLFAVCDAYYITSVVRQLKVHLGDSKRIVGPSANTPLIAPVQPTSSALHQQQFGKSNGSKIASPTQKCDPMRKIQIRVNNSQSVIGTVVAEPKTSRSKRIVAFWRGAIFKLAIVASHGLFSLLIRCLPSVFRKEPAKIETVDENGSDKAILTDTQPVPAASDTRRSKNGSRTNRSRPSRVAGGFRRLYGQLLVTNTDANLGSGNVVKTHNVLSTSGEDFEDVVRRKSSSRTPKLYIAEQIHSHERERQRQKSSESEKLEMSNARQSSQETKSDTKTERLHDDMPTTDDLILENITTIPDIPSSPADPSTGVTAAVSTGVNNGAVAVKGSRVSGSRGTGGGDGQSADDECSSLDDEGEDVERGSDDDCQRQSSPLPPVTAAQLSNTSDEEHDNNKPSSPSSSSNESNPTATSAMQWLPGSSSTGRQQKSTSNGRFHNTSNQQQNEWHSRKQQRLSEQPPRLQRRHLQNSGITSDHSPQRQPGNSSSLRHLGRPVGDVSVPVTSKPSVLPLGMFYRGGHELSSASGLTTPLALGTEQVSQVRAINTPYLIAEATMKRVMGSHGASQPLDQKDGGPPSSSGSSSLRQPLTWAHQIGQAPLPLVDSLQMVAQTHAPAVDPSWLAPPMHFSLAPSLFPSSTSHPTESNSVFEQQQQQQAVSPAPFSIPSLQFAESLLDEPDSVNSSRSASQNVMPVGQLPSEPVDTTLWTWGSDPVWNPKQTQPVQNEISNSTWDNPWAAHFVKALWGSPEGNKDSDSYNKPTEPNK